MVENEIKGVRRVNRPRWEGGGRRVIKKILAKRNWFKRKKKDGSEVTDEVRTRRGVKTVDKESKDDTEPETVLFIPSTPGGELLKRMREADANYRRGTSMRQIKFIERVGVSLKDTLVSSNPWGEVKCGRDDCFVCRGEKGGMGSCMKESVLYTIRCEECKRANKTVEYWGETGRDCFSRGGEHLKGCRERKDDNPMWKHLWDSHKGEKGEEIFTMKMEKGFKKPLARQIREGVEIEMSNETLMNSKSEWNSARIPRIVIEEGERQTEDIESALGKKGEQEKSERRKECLVELNKSIKRGGGELDREGERILEVKKRRVETVRQIPDSTVPQKRKSRESERHKAEVRKQI